MQFCCRLCGKSTVVVLPYARAPAASISLRPSPLHGAMEVIIVVVAVWLRRLAGNLEFGTQISEGVKKFVREFVIILPARAGIHCSQPPCRTRKYSSTRNQLKPPCAVVACQVLVRIDKRVHMSTGVRYPPSSLKARQGYLLPWVLEVLNEPGRRQVQLQTVDAGWTSRKHLLSVDLARKQTQYVLQSRLERFWKSGQLGQIMDATT